MIASLLKAHSQRSMTSRRPINFLFCSNQFPQILLLQLFSLALATVCLDPVIIPVAAAVPPEFAEATPAVRPVHSIRLSPLTGVPATIEVAVDDPTAGSARVLIQFDNDHPILVPMERVTKAGKQAQVFRTHLPSPRNRLSYRYSLETRGVVTVSDQYLVEGPCRFENRAGDLSVDERNLSIELAVYRAATGYARKSLERGLGSTLSTVGPASNSDPATGLPQLNLNGSGKIKLPELLHCEEPWTELVADEDRKDQIKRMQGERDALKRALVNLLPASALNYLSQLEKSRGLASLETRPLDSGLSAEELSFRLGRLLLSLEQQG
jgi:hypothetical protein